MFIDFIERETSMWERNIDQLLPVCAPSGHWTQILGMCPAWNLTCDLLVYGTMLQPTEPPGQGMNHLVFVIFRNLKFPNVVSCISTHLFTSWRS